MDTSLHGAVTLDSLCSAPDIEFKELSVKEKYKIGKVVGTGGYSIVKVVQNRFSNEPAAIKIIRKWELSDR